MTKLSTSPNECHYTTLWNRTSVSLFITTVMQVLNVMTNWQLWTNTSQQMFKVFLFGFDTCIKTISPLIICLINDALFDQDSPACNVSSGTLAECLRKMGPTDLHQMPVFLAIWWVVLCVPDAPSWLSTKSLTVSMLTAVCGCTRSANAWLSICFAVSHIFLGRLPKVDLIILEGEKCPSVRPSVHKKFLRFEWNLVCR